MANLYLLVIAVIVMSYGYRCENNNTSKFGFLRLGDGILDITCYNEALQNIIFPPIEYDEDITWVSFNDCVPSEIPYTKVLRQLNADLSKVVHLLITYEIFIPLADTIDFKAIQFEGFTAKKLTVSSIIQRLHINSLDFLNRIHNLTTLALENVDMPPLPETTRLDTVFMTGGKSLSSWGGCAELRYIKLHNWNVDNVPNDWLRNCSKLTRIDLININSYVLRKTVSNLEQLRILLIRHSDVSIPNHELSTLKNLEELTLYLNGMSKLSLSSLEMVSLAKLDIFEEDLELEGLPIVRAPQFVLSLNNKTVIKWRFEKEDYERLPINETIMNHAYIKSRSKCLTKYLGVQKPEFGKLDDINK